MFSRELVNNCNNRMYKDWDTNHWLLYNQMGFSSVTRQFNRYDAPQMMRQIDLIDAETFFYLLKFGWKIVYHFLYFHVFKLF